MSYLATRILFRVIGVFLILTGIVGPIRTGYIGLATIFTSALFIGGGIWLIRLARVRVPN
jgi:hypothetical protein